jgi:RimJ/RimL family protein N-acetyltransferase
MIESSLAALRAIEAEDLQTLREWRNRPEYRRFFREVGEISASQQATWYSQTVLSDPNTFMFAILERSTSNLIGAGGICSVDWVSRSCELSIYLGDRDLYIDKVFAPEAAQLLIDYAFSQLSMHRIWVEIYEFDVQKRELVEGLSFSLEGTLRDHHFSDGEWHDSLLFGLLADESE